MKLLVFLAFLAACFFFGLAVFGGSLSGVNLLDAGLFSTAIGLALGSAPA
jgi:hypothetical protein